MPRTDINPRTAGRTRPNAKAERGRVKRAWQADRRPLGPMADWTADTLVLLVSTPPRPTSHAIRQAAETAIGSAALLDDTSATVRAAAWELGVSWGHRVYAPAAGPHAGWVAVELLAAPADCTPADRVGRVGRLLAALALAAVAVVRPATADVRPVTPEVARLLADGQAAAAFGT